MLSNADRPSAVFLGREGPFPATSPGEDAARRDPLPARPGFVAPFAPPAGLLRDAGAGFAGRCGVRGPASRSNERFEMGERTGFSGEGAGVSMELEVFQRLSRSSFRGATRPGGPDIPSLGSTVVGHEPRAGQNEIRDGAGPRPALPPRERGRAGTRLPRRVSRSSRLPSATAPASQLSISERITTSMRSRL